MATSPIISPYEKARYELGPITETLPHLYHRTTMISDFHFTDRLDQYAIMEPGARLLFIDLGHPTLTGPDWIDEMVARSHLPWQETEALITHFHHDHSGNLDYFAHQGGGRCYTGPLRRMDRDFFFHFMERSGWIGHLDREDRVRVADHLVYLFDPQIPEGIEAVELRNGEVLDLGAYQLEVIHTPGHTFDHICLADHEDKLLFAGDHVVDSAPVVLQFHEDDRLTERYLASFSRIKAMRFETVLMSHHEPLRGEQAIAELCDTIVERFQRPLSKRRAILAERGPLTVYEVTLAAESRGVTPLLGNLDFFARRIATSFAHLEFLRDTGEATRRLGPHGAFVYELA